MGLSFVGERFLALLRGCLRLPELTELHLGVPCRLKKPVSFYLKRGNFCLQVFGLVLKSLKVHLLACLGNHLTEDVFSSSADRPRTFKLLGDCIGCVFIESQLFELLIPDQEPPGLVSGNAMPDQDGCGFNDLSRLIPVPRFWEEGEELDQLEGLRHVFKSAPILFEHGVRCEVVAKRHDIYFFYAKLARDEKAVP